MKECNVSLVVQYWHTSSHMLGLSLGMCKQRKSTRRCFCNEEASMLEQGRTERFTWECVNIVH